MWRGWPLPPTPGRRSQWEPVATHHTPAGRRKWMDANRPAIPSLRLTRMGTQAQQGTRRQLRGCNCHNGRRHGRNKKMAGEV